MTVNKNWLATLLRKDSQIIANALLLGVLVGLLNLLQAVVVQRLIDEILPNGYQDLVFISLILLSIVLLFRALLNYVRNLILLKHHVNFNRDLVVGFFNKLYMLPVAFFESRSSGELIARISDSKKIQKVIQLLIGTFIVDILVTLVILFAIAWYSFTICLVVTLVLSVLVLLLAKFSQIIQRAHQKVMMAFGRRESIFIETIENMVDIQLNNAEPDFSNRSTGAHKSMQDHVYRLGYINLKCGLGSELLGLVLLVLPMLLGSVYILRAQLLVGEWVAILFLLSGVTPAMSRMVLFNTQFKEAKVAFQRLDEIWCWPAENRSQGETTKVKIETIKVDQLQFGYPGKSVLFSNLSFELKRNCLTVLSGSSGSGKSTLLDLIQKVHSADAGRLLVNQRDLNTWSISHWRKQLGVVPQKVKLFDLALAQNISLDLSQNQPFQVESFCKKMGFHLHLGVLSKHFQTPVGSSGLQLSGGEAQMIAWARALYRRPQVLLLDEATTFLDREKKAFVLDLLQRIKHKTLILMISHDPEVLAHADQVIRL